MALSATQFTLLCVIGIILLARPAHAFGAGNIGSTSKIEGQNWRHGDLEDTFLTLVASKAMGGKKFSKLDVKRIYFGNWLRDYSQAVDVGTVKNISAEAIRIVLWILGFMSFGYGTKEFEVTTERLGCYRPEEHIDNPKDYADNEDARNYDRRLRGPVDERRELAIDPELGLKAYIASENLGIDTSAKLVRNLFGRSIELGRRYGRSKNKADLYEALRLLGTGCHCLEDFSAHSNYTELALIELGERDIFPHVGRRTQVNLRGARSAVFPLVTGTFGGVDFLHSVTGEFNDKVTQSEIQELEGTLQQAQQQGGNPSILQDLLHSLPDGIFGGKDEAGKADELKVNATQHAMAHAQVSPRQPEAWLSYIHDAQKQIYPIMEWHDEIMQSISEFIEKIPILPDILERVQEEVNVFAFSLIAPFILPIINQIKNELNTGSSAIIQSSMDKQHIVFSDDYSSDPTHSMLSKDHFSNVLNEPAGKVAGQVLRWVVPQLIAAWDDERMDIERTLNRIIRGVFHHPALRHIGDDGAADGRGLMFSIVQKWWEDKSEREKDGLRQQLSREGVESGRNHKPGVKDHGHGSAKKLGMPNVFTANHQGAPGGFGGPSAGSAYAQEISQLGQSAGAAVGGGVIGGIVGGLATAVGTGVVAGALGEQQGQSQSRTSYGQAGHPQTYSQTSRGADGSRTQISGQFSGSRTGGNFAQSEHSRTDDRHGGRTEQHSSYQQQHGGSRQTGYTSYESQTSYSSSSYQQQESREYGSGNTYGQQQSIGGEYGSGYNSGQNTYGQPTTGEYGTGYNSGRNTYGEQQSTGGQYSSGFESGRNTYGQSETSSGGYGTGFGSGGNIYGQEGRTEGYGAQTSSFNRRGSDEERSGYGSQTQGQYGQSTYGQTSYGRSGDDENRGTYGRRNSGSDNERPTYGRRNSGSDNERSGHGRRRGSGSNERRQTYGQQERDSDDENRRGGYGQSGYGRDNDNERPTYGRRNSGSDNERSGYGRREKDSDDEQSSQGRRSGYNTGGYGRNEGGNEYGSGGYGQQQYGSDRGSRGNQRGSDDESSERMPGGFGGGDEDEGRRGGYGQRQDEDEGGYGGGRQYGGYGY